MYNNRIDLYVRVRVKDPEQLSAAPGCVIAQGPDVRRRVVVVVVLRARVQAET